MEVPQNNCYVTALWRYQHNLLLLKRRENRFTSQMKLSSTFSVKTLMCLIWPVMFLFLTTVLTRESQNRRYKASKSLLVFKRLYLLAKGIPSPQLLHVCFTLPSLVFQPCHDHTCKWKLTFVVAERVPFSTWTELHLCFRSKMPQRANVQKWTRLTGAYYFRTFERLRASFGLFKLIFVQPQQKFSCKMPAFRGCFAIRQQNVDCSSTFLLLLTSA